MEYLLRVLNEYIRIGICDFEEFENLMVFGDQEKRLKIFGTITFNERRIIKYK